MTVENGRMRLAQETTGARRPVAVAAWRTADTAPAGEADAVAAPWAAGVAAVTLLADDDVDDDGLDEAGLDEDEEELDDLDDDLDEDDDDLDDFDDDELDDDEDDDDDEADEIDFENDDERLGNLYDEDDPDA